MVANIESQALFKAVSNLYSQAVRIDPRFKGATPDDLIKAEAFGAPRDVPLKLKQIQDGADAGKLTLEQLTDGAWVPLEGIVPADYSNLPVYPQA